MKKKEKELFKEICKFKQEGFNESLLAYATPHVLGHLFFNRMQGVAYGRLEAANALGKVNREFRNSLKSAYEQNVEKNRSFYICVAKIAKLLSPLQGRIAMLKGAYLCRYYPQGYRVSNDIDLLALPQDITTIGMLLSGVGFRQGTIKNGVFIPAKRQEIIASKMLRGETVPYIKQVDMPGMKYLEIDINFSLDYKNGNDDLVANMLDRVVVLDEKMLGIPTLCREDFIIHLCAHLYKEATTLPWVEMKRDMTLYKYADIYMLLKEMTKKELEAIWVRATELGLEKECAYAIFETAELFDMQNHPAVEMAWRKVPNAAEVLYRVISPKDNKVYIYQTKDATMRFFMDNRRRDLKEVEDEWKN